MADLKISQLPSLAESDIAAGDELAVVDTSASQTSKATVKAILEKGFTLVDTGSIPSSALAGIPSSSVTSSSVVNGAITYDKLNSTQIARGLSVDTSAGNIGISNSVNAGSKGGIVFNQYGLVTGTQNIPSADLPLSTTSAVGGVSVSTGLAVSGAGALSIATGGVTYDMLDSADVGRGLSIDSSAGNIGISNSVSAGSKAGISFNSQGLITGVSALIPSADLPKAGTSTSAIGGIFVASSGSGLTLDASTGELKVDTSGLTSAQIGTGAVQTSNLDSGAVTDAKVTDVSGAKLLAGTVTYDKIDANDIGRGLSVDTSAGNIGLSNSITAGSRAGITYDQYGQITSVATLIPATDLPAATTSTLGAISVSNGLSVTAGGALSVSGITNAMLSADSVQTTQIQNNAVTNDKISGVSGAKVTAGTLSPNALNSANVTNGLTISGGNLQIDNSVSGGASSFAGLSFNDQGLITSVSALVPSTDLPIASSNALGAVKVGSDLRIDPATGVLSIDTDGIGQSNLQDNCVGTAELAPGAVDNTALGTNLSGAKISDNSLPATALVTADLDRSINISANKLGINNAVTASTHSGLSFNSEGLITGTSAILSTELPIAGASAVGAVSVASNSGLAVTTGGALSLATTTTGQTINGFVYNDFGQITSASSLSSTDLPKASTTAIGAVKIPTSSSPLAVDASGTLSIAASNVVAGSNYTKFDVNAQGFVTNASNLTGSDIPAHSASLLTSGILPIARIGANAITASKIADECTTLFGGPGSTSNIVTFPTASFKGQRFWDDFNNDEYIWTGSSWAAVTITSGDLIYGGTYDASSGQNVVKSVTTAGAAAGLQTGTGLPVASATNIRVYVVVSDAGTGSGNAPSVSLAPPDMLVSNGASAWDLVDVSNAIAGQSASNISVTPYQNLNSINAQAALQELEDEKVSKAGTSTVTGTLEIGATGVFRFEGSTENDYEIRLNSADPLSADRVLTLPDEDGNLVSTGSSGVVTSAMVSNDLSNANIASSAAISFTKLATLADGNILVGNSSGQAASVAMTGDVAISNSGATTIQPSSVVDSMISGTISASKLQAGTTSNAGVLQLVDATDSASTTLAATGASVKAAYDLANQADTTASAAAAKSGDTFTGNVIISDAKELRFGEVASTGSNYISFKAPDSIASDISLVWPDTSPSPGQILKANASNANQLEWSSDAIDVAAANLTGTTMASNVVTSSLTTVGTLGSLTVSGTITGDVIGALTGNADTATTLATARAINGVSFDGSADITVTAAASTLTGTSLNSSITGSSLTSVGTLSNLTVSGTITGNASTATALATAINIGGVSFDGTADIDLPGVNTAGTQDTSGTAAKASAINVTAQNSVLATVYPLFAGNGATATGHLTPSTDTDFKYNPNTGELTAEKFLASGTIGRVQADNSLAFLSGGTEYLRVDTDGRCIVGGGTHSGDSNLVVKGDNNLDGNNHAVLGLFGDIVVSAANTELAQLKFGASNTNTGNARIRVKSDGAWSSGDRPTAMLFETTPDGSSTMTTALTIDSSQDATFTGNILMSGTGVIDIPAGTTAQRPGSANTGMFRYNTTLDQFEGYSSTGWGAIGGAGGGATGGGTDEIFIENEQTVTTSYTLSTNENAVTVGDLTVNNGVTITIPNNAIWVVL